jgi:pyruvate/2-oxoglutarate dehydrogenase complex dihydrolipoamide dehydrogenase (E3) component
VPELAAVGLTEAAAAHRGLKVEVRTSDMSAWLSSRTYADTVAWAKILVDPAGDRIVGAHMVGHSGQELINFFALSMRHGITAGQMRDMVYAYPTFAAVTSMVPPKYWRPSRRRAHGQTIMRCVNLHEMRESARPSIAPIG